MNGDRETIPDDDESETATLERAFILFDAFDVVEHLAHDLNAPDAREAK